MHNSCSSALRKRHPTGCRAHNEGLCGEEGYGRSLMRWHRAPNMSCVRRGAEKCSINLSNLK